jgi:hypothetical protein
MLSGSSKTLDAVATIPLTIALERTADNPFVILADWVVWDIFLLDFLAGPVAAKDGGPSSGHDPLGLAIVILSLPLFPSALGLIRSIGPETCN